MLHPTSCYTTEGGHPGSTFVNPKLQLYIIIFLVPSILVDASRA